MKKTIDMLMKYCIDCLEYSYWKLKGMRSKEDSLDYFLDQVAAAIDILEHGIPEDRRSCKFCSLIPKYHPDHFVGEETDTQNGIFSIVKNPKRGYIINYFHNGDDYIDDSIPVQYCHHCGRKLI